MSKQVKIILQMDAETGKLQGQVVSGMVRWQGAARGVLSVAR